MRRRLTGCAILFGLLCAVPAGAAPILTLLPDSGSLVGAPGATVGWGYQIANDDPTEWLVVTSLSTDPFQFGIGSDAIFDFPIVAPGMSVIVPYIAAAQGLYEFTWDATAPAGFVNTGLFTIGAEFWDADPFAGGQFAASLPDFTAAYSVSMPQQTPVPEPATVVLLSAGLCVAGLARRRAVRSRFSRCSRRPRWPYPPSSSISARSVCSRYDPSTAL